MAPIVELRATVDAAFAVGARGLRQWPDPHPDRSVLDEEYSRLLDPAKWRLLGARADAWVSALTELGLADATVADSSAWLVQPATVVTCAVLVVPVAAGALTLVLGRSRVGDVDDAGVTLGVGDPAVCVDWFPGCGCDACDSGSQDELDRLDARIASVVTGAFRRLTDGTRIITVEDAESWRSSGFSPRSRGDVEAALAGATGWDELVGASWLET